MEIYKRKQQPSTSNTVTTDSLLTQNLNQNSKQNMQQNLNQNIIQKSEKNIQNNPKFNSESFEKDIKITLGLLLKHRGGPGFGHGRLQGNELLLLENNLKNITKQLLIEAK